MENVVGTTKLKLLEYVDKEIESVSKKQKKLLLELLKNRYEIIPDLKKIKHPNKILVSLSSQNKWPILTIDTDLKHLLIKQKKSYIEVTSEQYLRLVKT